MTNNDNRPQDAADLRRKAEALARERVDWTSQDSAALSPEEIRETLHELRVHQIELEMQNNELRKAQAEIEAGRARYFDLYDLAPVGYCTLSEKGLILEANLTAAVLLDTVRSALVKQPISRFILKEDQDIYYLHRKTLFETGETQECELRLVKPDGTLIWGHLTGTVAQARDGAPVFRVAISDITDRKHAEEALRESEETLRTTLHSISDAVIATDMKGRVTSMNPVAESLTGWSEKEATGQPLEAVFRIINEQTRQPVESPATNVLESGQMVGCATHALLLAKDGRKIPIPDSGAPIRNEAGEITGVVLVFRDQTKERAAQEALESNYALLQLAGETAKFGGWSVDLKSNICTWSDAVADVHDAPRGYAPSLQEGINFYTPEWREKITQLFSACAEKGIPYDEDMEIITQKGRRVWVRTIGNAVRNEADTIIKVQGSFQDITDRKRGEEALRDSEDRFRAMVEGAPDAVFVQTEKKFAYLNSRAVQLFGAEKETDLLGRSVMERFHPDYHERIKERIRRLYEKRQPVQDILKQRFLRLDGSEVWVETTGQPIVFDGKKGALVFVRNITERKREEKEREKLQSQLNQAQKMESIGRLAGGVAHDFNNMLSVILGHAEIALEQIDPGQPLFDDLQEVRKAAERSVNLTRQLLTFARKQTIAPKIIDLNETVEGMLTMLRRLIGEDIDLAWRPSKNLAPVKMDPSQIDHILDNLCVNARDAIDDVGKITIETNVVSFDEAYCAVNAGFVPGEYVLLAVSDNGCGMDPETISHLFEPFFTTKEQGKGTGLGLASVYGAVKQNNGFIHVYSEPGQGTTFRIYLSRHQAKTTLQADEATAKPIAGGSETILLVEDEPAILRMATMMLERLGYVVIAAKTPGEAIRLADEHSGSIDLLMTDVVMPEMNGRDLARNLLSIYPDIKHLFMSGYTAEVIAYHGVLDEGVHFIQKPFLLKHLGEKLREVLES